MDQTSSLQWVVDLERFYCTFSFCCAAVTYPYVFVCHPIADAVGDLSEFRGADHSVAIQVKAVEVLPVRLQLLGREP